MLQTVWGGALPLGKTKLDSGNWGSLVTLTSSNSLLNSRATLCFGTGGALDGTGDGATNKRLTLSAVLGSGHLLKGGGRGDAGIDLGTTASAANGLANCWSSCRLGRGTAPAFTAVGFTRGRADAVSSR